MLAFGVGRADRDQQAGQGERRGCANEGDAPGQAVLMPARFPDGCGRYLWVGMLTCCALSALRPIARRAERRLRLRLTRRCCPLCRCFELCVFKCQRRGARFRGNAFAYGIGGLLFGPQPGFGLRAQACLLVCARVFSRGSKFLGSGALAGGTCGSRLCLDACVNGGVFGANRRGITISRVPIFTS